MLMKLLCPAPEVHLIRADLNALPLCSHILMSCPKKTRREGVCKQATPVCMWLALALAFDLLLHWKNKRDWNTGLSLPCPLWRILGEQSGASYVVLLVKNIPAKEGDARNTAVIPGSGRSPREGDGNPLQYSCLGNPMDRGAWWATIHGFPKGQTQLITCARAHTHTHTHMGSKLV